VLPGDLMQRALKARIGRRVAVEDDADGQEPERTGGTFNPQTVAEFLAYDVPFRTPPAQGFVFPPGPHDD
jgi:hypothetical protein